MELDWKKNFNLSLMQANLHLKCFFGLLNQYLPCLGTFYESSDMRTFKFCCFNGESIAVD